MFSDSGLDLAVQNQQEDVGIAQVNADALIILAQKNYKKLLIGLGGIVALGGLLYFIKKRK